MFNLVGKSLGRYHIIEQLGEGGMATVYKGYDTALERSIAIKVIRTESSAEPDFIKRFRREARALAQMDHPYILKVLDYGEQDGLPFLVMPFIQGGTLKQKLSTSMPYKKAAEFLAPVARALEYAHKQGIIHRDVKPANILIDASGSPLLSDFGIAKMLDTQEATQLTGTGVGIGTPDYMAPEQWLGQASPATDIYSLGVVFYEMVTGRKPYAADTPAAVLLKHMNDPLPRPKSFIPDLPDSVEGTIFKALAKKPEDRFVDMGTFASVLEAMARNENVPAMALPTQVSASVQNQIPVTRSQTPKKAGSGAPVWAGIAIAVVLVGFVVILCLAGGYLLFNNKVAKTDLTKTPSNLETTSNPILSTSTPDNPRTNQDKTAIPAQNTPSLRASDTKVAPFTSIEGLPADIPILVENNGDLMTSTQQGMTMYTFSTPLSMKEASDFYNQEMTKNGWTVINKTEQAGKMIVYTFSKQDNQRMVNIISTVTDDKTFVSIQLITQ